MRFYDGSFRLLSTSIIFIIACNIFAKAIIPKYYEISIKNGDNQYLLMDGDENLKQSVSTALIILVGTNEEVKHETLNVPIYENLANLRIVKDKEDHSALRDKRENACIKVAIRKCYKALMSVKTKLCKLRYRCSRRFKDSFIEYSKKACIAEFDYSVITDENNHKPEEYIRPNYLKFCIPYMTKELKAMFPNEEDKNVTDLVTHIFRTSDTTSLSKCQKICQAKCIHACGYVRKRVCSIYGCGKTKTHFFTKACKVECQREYRVSISSESSDSD